jgi:hypothetical protein
MAWLAVTMNGEADDVNTAVCVEDVGMDIGADVGDVGVGLA